jgi:hypothetical protein
MLKRLDTQMPGYPDACPDTQMPKCLPRYLDAQMPRCLSICLDAQVPRRPDIQIIISYTPHNLTEENLGSIYPS